MEMKPEIIASDIGQSVTAQPDEVFLNPPTPSDMETHISFEPELSDSDWFAGDNETLAPMETWTTQMDILDTSSVVGKNRLLFYWFDAYEDSRHQAGVVYLFGKVGAPNCSVTHNTCCLRIKDLERRVYLLPRPELVDSDPNFSMKDVYAEFRDISVERKIGKFRCKPSTKRYAFELPDVPIETEYLEVRYSAAFPSLPSDLQGKTFSRIFGTNTSFLENLILDLQLRGPCWLVVDSATPVQPQFSWCNSDYEVSWRCDAQCPLSKLSTLVERASADRGDSNKTIPSLPPSPPLCLVAINIKAVTQPQANHSEIISIGLLIDHTYSLDRPLGRSMFQSHYLVLGCPKDAALPYDLRTKLPNFGEQYAPPAPNWPNNQPSSDDENHSAQVRGGARRIVSGSVGGIDVEPNERALLARFLTRLHRLDPDLLVGHDLWGHQIELLIQRLIANKVPHWHRVGRLRRSAQFVTNANSRTWLIRNAIPGRLVCDTLISARELVRSRTYNLSDLAGQVLAGSTGSSAARRKIPEPLLRFLHKTTGVSNDDLLGFDLTDFDIDSADLRCLFTSSELVKQLIDFCLSDAHIALRLAHQLQGSYFPTDLTSAPAVYSQAMDNSAW
ncbi:unnamed protein product [Dicrocoelium dendriticum]|nr:unnamed protein product [Dicrocoelium dendriticum]